MSAMKLSMEVKDIPWLGDSAVSRQLILTACRQYTENLCLCVSLQTICFSNLKCLGSGLSHQFHKALMHREVSRASQQCL
ncbi:hypothetical protein F2P79_005824 [Pimephales promelas]|nr:hypothetical protein F2P79_005824 [Pimephales promelas]